MGAYQLAEYLIAGGCGRHWARLPRCSPTGCVKPVHSVLTSCTAEKAGPEQLGPKQLLKRRTCFCSSPASCAQALKGMDTTRQPAEASSALRRQVEASGTCGSLAARGCGMVKGMGASLPELIAVRERTYTGPRASEGSLAASRLGAPGASNRAGIHPSIRPTTDIHPRTGICPSQSSPPRHT